MSRESLLGMGKDFTYTGSKCNEISFPLGGIGTGSIGLAGNGRLIDWEIFNQPNKGRYNGFSFFSIKAERQGKVLSARVLQGDLHPPYSGSMNRPNYRGFGFGPDRESMAAFPHFKSVSFKGEFPFSTIDYACDDEPFNVRLIAFNPLIPLNDHDSSLPVAIFTYEVTNRSDEPLDVSVVGNLTNPFEEGAVNTFVERGMFRGIKLSTTKFGEDSPRFGDLSLTTNCEDVSYQSYWYRGGWFDNVTIFWKEFSAPGRFKERNYDQTRGERSTYNRQDVCLVSGHKTLAPHETYQFQFLITWNIPNFVNYWNPGTACSDSSCNGLPPQWKNYYATLFTDSLDSADYVWENAQRLYDETKLFHDTLFASTLPDYVLEAVSSNIAILKSPTCVRLTDGTLYGFEGCHDEAGCCEGSCSHVWNYDQATPFLFPELARSMRNIEYKYTMYPTGKMMFRIMLPPERTFMDVSKNSAPTRAAADGQMGEIIKVYREWKIAGDLAWLKSIWPRVKQSLEYAWSPENEDWWDRDCDGVIEGIQHHTLDVEIYGPNSYITGYYHAALKAAAEIARALGDYADAEKYGNLLERGRQWVDQNLFNGEYFHQQISLQDDRFPIDPELGEIKYQIVEGCHIDQVIGQWHAHINGLGYIFDEEKVRQALQSIYRYNFLSLRDYPNACRIYALNDERGLLICTWPTGNSPKVPVPYADECMNGFEYQAACHMIYEGLLEEGLSVVQAIRERYDGERRNPWNEFECGSNYARSMASYALLLALSGFEFDMRNGTVGFSPKLDSSHFQVFWSLDRAWGQFESSNDQLRFTVKRGQIHLAHFRSVTLAGRTVQSVQVGQKQIAFEQAADAVDFSQPVDLIEGDTLHLQLV